MMFTEDEIAEFSLAASAALAHAEVVDAAAEGVIQVSDSVLIGPYANLLELLTRLASKYPHAQGISFRKQLFLLPRSAEPGLRIIKEDRVVKLPDIAVK